MICFDLLHPEMTHDHLGLIPMFFSEFDPRSAAEQVAQNYAHGGGWSPIAGFDHSGEGVIHFPGDPEFKPLASYVLHRDSDKPETLRFYDHSIFAIFQQDGSFEVGRLD